MARGPSVRDGHRAEARRPFVREMHRAEARRPFRDMSTAPRRDARSGIPEPIFPRFPKP